MVEYLGPYVTPTTFVVSDILGQSEEGLIEKRFIICVFQKFVNGISLRKALDKIQGDTSIYKDFLQRCLKMYEETEIVPDITARPTIIGWWKPIDSPNVIVEQNENGQLIPQLVDIGFISGEWPLIRSEHPRILTNSIRKLLESL